MTEVKTQTTLGRIAKSVIDRFLRHVSWHASETMNLARMPGDHYPLIVILGREHYSERSKIYPALRRRDLQKVLDGELAGGPPTLALPAPLMAISARSGFINWIVMLSFHCRVACLLCPRA